MFQIPAWEDEKKEYNIKDGQHKSVKTNTKLVNKSNKKIRNATSVVMQVKAAKGASEIEKSVKPDNLKKAKRKKKKEFSKKHSQHNNMKSHTENPSAVNEKSLIKKGKKRKRSSNDLIIDEVKNFDTDKPDEIILNAKKKRFNETIQNEDQEDVLFSENSNKNEKNAGHKCNNNKVKTKQKSAKIEMPTENKTVVIDHKKEKFRKTLDLYKARTSLNVTGNKLRERMLDRLKAAKFRYLNEKLYTSSGAEAKELFQSDPAAFQTYHQGYQQQLSKWPVKPLDVIINKISKMPKSITIADMGCGEALLSKRVPHKVRSFDLVATAPDVEVCDIAHTPLLSQSTDVAVYCLALMGTELTQYLLEANRVLKMGGQLLIAEVESRFTKVEEFTNDVQKLGFKLKNLDKKHQVFFFMEFVKIRDPPVKKAKLPTLSLKPCLYKKR